MSEVPQLPPGVSRRQFLEDVLDVTGDADVIYEHGPGGGPQLAVRRIDLINALAQEMAP